jgi:hypothetical protein
VARGSWTALIWGGDELRLVQEDGRTGDSRDGGAPRPIGGGGWQLVVRLGLPGGGDRLLADCCVFGLRVRVEAGGGFCALHSCTVGRPVGVLDRQTYRGGTRGSRLYGGDRDRETENSKVCARTRDTRFIQVRTAKVASPTSCLGDQVWRPALGVGLSPEGLGCAARYPALLYIVQGAGS